MMFFPSFPPDQLSADEIQRRLRPIQRDDAALLPASNDVTSLRKAAVLLPLLRNADHWELLFIRRAEHAHDQHSGQVAFPGGKQDASDPSLKRTALREAQEEIGLEPHAVKLLGTLSPQHSVSRFQILPVVGLIPWPYSLTPSPREVAHCFTIPLHWLANPQNRDISHLTESPDQRIPYGFFKPYAGEVLWGASAKMTLELLDLLTGKP